ncbi:MAG: hypothetical protein KDK24_00870 [Pseudooceanicola sp.]|nr:hypothetical protein [Pseudooceanicola sp.]
MRQPLTTLAALAALSLPAAAQEDTRPRFADLFTVESLGTLALHSVMSWARLLADVRYDQVSVDPLAMKITLTGLRIAPYLPDRPEGMCQARVERLTINGQPIDVRDTWRFRIALDGAAMEAGCLPFEVAGMLRGIGLPQVTAGRIETDLTYDYPSGGMLARISADLDKLATVNADIDLDYISYRMDFTREKPEPVGGVDLNGVVIAVQDRGAWDIARKFMPPERATPEALAPVVGAGLEQMLAQANDGAALTDRQAAFARDAGAVAASFLTSGRQIVVATAVEQAPLRIDLGKEPRFAPLFDALNPSVSHSQPLLSVAIPVADLDAALKAETPPADAFAIGRALMTGIGAPKNVNGGIKLLLPLARAGDTRASFLIASEIAETNPVDAYSHALRAAPLPGGLALLDRIERKLSFADALKEQRVLMGGPDEALYGDIAGMRTAAREFLGGTRRPRSWLAAYYWSSLGAAAGDAASAALRDEIGEIMRLRGDAAAWAPEAASIDAGVLRDWIAKDVPGRLR